MGTALIFLAVASALSTPPVCYLMQEGGPARVGGIDPQLLWKNIKRPLTGADGLNYFNDSLKGAMVPTLKGKMVKLEPEIKPKTIVLAIEDGTTADATLKFEMPLAGKVEAGTELSFEGVVESYTVAPYMLVFDVDPANLHGWTGKNAPVHKKTSTSK